MKNRPATQAKAPSNSESRKRSRWRIVGGALVAAAIIAIGWHALFGTSPSDVADPGRHQPPVKEVATAPPKPRKVQLKKKRGAARSAPVLIDDDGRALWISPTHGKPLNLAYLSPGAQIIVALRPQTIANHPEGKKLLAAAGPIGHQWQKYLDDALLSPAGLRRLLIGCELKSDGTWHVTLVAQLSGTETAQQHIDARLHGAVQKRRGGATYWLQNGRAYFVPKSRDKKLLVVAPEGSINDVIDLSGNPPPLRRDIERLLTHTDADRDATIILAPNSLFSEGQSIFAGELAGLRRPLFWFLGDELSGVALSAHLDEKDFFLELIATPTLDYSPERAARIFMGRVAKVPDMLAKYLASLHTQPYDREIVARFPAMLRTLVAYTRSGQAPDHAVLRCYLPVIAGHNLLMAAELTLAESQHGAMQLVANNAADGDASTATTSASIRARLRKVTSLRFTKDTLEAALEQLSQDIEVPIVIRGPDLQADGITKNQSFGIDLSNKPAEEILVQILRLANPDKSATSGNDIRQKLVYVIEQKPDRTEQIVITTRARAAERHDELPPAFRAAKP
ncbi:MAG TPA: hypothetical protein VHE81_10850 [Lacipirellulaceae bacterium]|nr:hypothetical protein [Lacipirellulaceae bacterium]